MCLRRLLRQPAGLDKAGRFVSAVSYQLCEQATCVLLCPNVFSLQCHVWEPTFSHDGNKGWIPMKKQDQRQLTTIDNRRVIILRNCQVTLYRTSSM